MADHLPFEIDNFFEISTKSGEGFDELFEFLVQRLGTTGKERGDSLRRSRIRIDDRVSIRDKHGIAHHGTVCWTGVKKRPSHKDEEMCIEIKMVISNSHCLCIIPGILSCNVH
jgi:hypothetical protein